jgi:hypothetical protein
MQNPQAAADPGVRWQMQLLNPLRNTLPAYSARAGGGDRLGDVRSVRWLSRLS